MSSVNLNNFLQSVRASISNSESFSNLIEKVSEVILDHFDCDCVISKIEQACNSQIVRLPNSLPGNFTDENIVVQLRNEEVYFDQSERAIQLPCYLSDTSRVHISPKIRELFEKNSIKSWAIIALSINNKVIGYVELRYFTKFHRFLKEEMQALEQLAYCLESYILGMNFSSLKPLGDSSSSSLQIVSSSRYGDTYKRLAKFGNVVIIRADKNFIVDEVVGDLKDIIGVELKESINDRKIWNSYLDVRDIKRLKRLVAKLRHAPQEIREEIRILPQIDRPGCTLLIRAMPLYSEKGELSGWEGFAVDISEKKIAEEKALQQKRRIEALYEIARSSQMHHDPAIVMLKGLRAVIKATISECGFACFYDRNSDQIEIVALEGLSQQFVSDIQAKINLSGVVRHVIQHKEAILSGDISIDPRGLVDVTHREGIKSAILAPLMIDDSVVGVVVVYCRTADRYDKDDLELVNAAASQIAISSRQAEYYALEKQHADSLAALYRVSHELSKYVSVREVAENAFPLVQKEFACKRMWLGIVNEQGTHIVGQAGFGPDIRQRLINIQIELYLRHDFLDEALRTKQAVIVKEGQQLECSGLNSIIEKLKIGTLVIIPLISLGQVVGVLIAEPVCSSFTHAERKLPLITNMANEIATVILARRFESKMAEADKMRMAGMLASGVAHNFNNLLQAVMGQASLLEMQLPKDSPLVKSARMIIDAAGKGASLITQLLSFSSTETNKRKTMSLEEFIRESEELYKSILGSTINLEILPTSNLAHVYADYGQLQQVMSNLLVNAKEALSGRNEPRLTISLNQVKLRSGEVDPDLAPGEYVRLDVEDNGVGMDSERQARCFEPFYSSKNVDTRTGIGFSGSGLGLSSTYSIMKQHDGLVSVRSTPGIGTVFSLYLPLANSKKINLPEDLKFATLAQEHSDVLLFDMEDSVQQTLRPVFEALGLRSLAATEIQRALDIIRRPGCVTKAVLVDVDKSGYDSLAFLRSLRKELPHVDLIVITSDQRRWSRLVVDISSIQVIEKPLGIWGIHALARKILRQQSTTIPLDQQVTKEIASEGENPINNKSRNGELKDQKIALGASPFEKKI